MKAMLEKILAVLKVAWDYFNGKKTDIGVLLMMVGPFIKPDITLDLMIFGVHPLKDIVLGLGGLLLSGGIAHKVIKAKAAANEAEPPVPPSSMLFILAVAASMSLTACVGHKKHVRIVPQNCALERHLGRLEGYQSSDAECKDAMQELRWTENALRGCHDLNKQLQDQIDAGHEACGNIK